MRAALLTLYMYCQGMQNVSVNLKVDNIATMNWINKKVKPNDILLILAETF